MLLGVISCVQEQFDGFEQADLLIEILCMRSTLNKWVKSSLLENGRSLTQVLTTTCRYTSIRVRARGVPPPLGEDAFFSFVVFILALAGFAFCLKK